MGTIIRGYGVRIRVPGLHKGFKVPCGHYSRRVTSKGLRLGADFAHPTVGSAFLMADKSGRLKHFTTKRNVGSPSRIALGWGAKFVVFQESTSFARKISIFFQSIVAQIRRCIMTRNINKGIVTTNTNMLESPFVDENLILQEMTENDTNGAVSLISRSMNPNEGRWAESTITFHFFCKKNNIDDGRRYFILRKSDKIAGMTGLHVYSWGPQDTSWLGWFAVDPDFHGQKLGYFLMEQTVKFAKANGFRRLLVETYSDQDFAKARKFYERFGFKVVGNIGDYIKAGVDMVIFGLDL